MRRAYARRIEKLAGLRTAALTRAFAAVAREDFVGPGPWLLLRPQLDDGYVETPDADPARLYDTVLVALDRRRRLSNGEPVSVAQWLDLLELGPGDALAHIGCGVGYYTAVAAEVLRPGGRVLALDAAPDVAARAARNLGTRTDVTVRAAGRFDDADGPFDAIFANAGATHVPTDWLDRLSDGGRLLVPLTVSVAGGEIGAGRVLRVVRRDDRFTARFVSFAAIVHWADARSEQDEKALRDAYREGDAYRVRSLRRDPHAPGASCWLHAERGCISYEEADQ